MNQSIVRFLHCKSNYNYIYSNLLKSSKTTKKINDDEDSDNVEADYIRLMPHSEERIIRAQEKTKKQLKLDSKIIHNKKNSLNDVSHDDGDDEEYYDDVNDDLNMNDPNGHNSNSNSNNSASSYGMTEEEENEYFDAVLNTAQSKTNNTNTTQ